MAASSLQVIENKSSFRNILKYRSNQPKEFLSTHLKLLDFDTGSDNHPDQYHYQSTNNQPHCYSSIRFFYKRGDSIEWFWQHMHVLYPIRRLKAILPLTIRYVALRITWYLSFAKPQKYNPESEKLASLIVSIRVEELDDMLNLPLWNSLWSVATESELIIEAILLALG